MTEITTIDWFRRLGTFVFPENTAIFFIHDFAVLVLQVVLAADSLFC